ncbi:MAG: hypothetical protein IK118_05935 [Clostridia bacterium]|nr:hypothetical protein [Clostridia bacterium]
MTTFTKRTSGRLLAVLLSMLMIMTSVSVCFTASAAGANSVTTAQWSTLANALRSTNVANASFNGTNNVTVDDPSGDVYTAAQAYFAVLDAYIFKATGSSGSSGESEYNYRTSSQVRELIKTEMQSRMGDDYNAYNAGNVLTYLGGNVTVSGSTNTTQSSVPTTTVTVTVTRSSNILQCATLNDAKNMPTYKYTISHTNTRKYKPSGCGAKDTYYCTCSSTNETTGTVNYDISLLTAYQTALNNNAELLSADQAGQIALGYDALAAAYNAITTAKANAVNKFGATIVAHFFSAYDDAIGALETSMLIAQYIGRIAEIKEMLATDIDGFTKAQLISLYNNLDTAYTAYLNIGNDVVYTYFESGDDPILVRSEVEARFAVIQNAKEIAVLREDVQPLVNAALTTCENYDRAWMVGTANSNVLLQTSITELTAYQTTLTNEYKEENVKLVFGDDFFESFDERITELENLLLEYGYINDFASYKSVYMTAIEPVSLDSSEDQLYALLSSKDAWYSDLRAFIAELTAYDAEFAQLVMNGLDQTMQTKIDEIYTALNAKIEAKINTSYDLYADFVAQYGYTINTADDVSVQNYNALRTAFAQLNSTHYDFLAASPNFDIPEETVAKYNAVKNALFAFYNYDASKGLSAYQFNNQKLEDILRLVSTADVARNLDYTVDAEKRAVMYENVKALLGSDLVKGLLGDSFDLSSLGDTVKDFIFSDSLVNTLISLVYPIVIDNFAPVWATQLPETYQITQSGATFNFTIKPNLCSLREALQKLGLYALPNQLATCSVLDAYPEIQEKLAAVTYDPEYDAAQEKVTVNPWNDPSLVDEDGKLALEWGVHDKESFINALNAGLAGVEPIILALLANKTTSKQVDIRKNTIKASGKAYSIITVNVTLENIWLNMSFEGNPGFNNALAPILNALGAEDLANGNVGTLYELATCVADGFDQVINKISADSLDFILQALPNLAFALNYGLIMPLLSELKENIKYSASAYYTTDCSAAGPDTVTAVDETTIEINLGEMLNLEEMGIDLTSASGLINSIVGLIGGDEETEESAEPGEGDPVAEEEPATEEPSGIAAVLGLIDMDDLFSKLAFAGSDVSWHVGYRTVSPFSVAGMEGYMPYIESVPADLLMYIVQYLLDQIGANPDLLPQLIEMFSTSEEGEGVKSPPDCPRSFRRSSTT